MTTYNVELNLLPGDILDGMDENDAVDFVIDSIEYMARDNDGDLYEEIVECIGPGIVLDLIGEETIKKYLVERGYNVTEK